VGSSVPEDLVECPCKTTEECVYELAAAGAAPLAGGKVTHRCALCGAYLYDLGSRVYNRGVRYLGVGDDPQEREVDVTVAAAWRLGGLNAVWQTLPMDSPARNRLLVLSSTAKHRRSFNFSVELNEEQADAFLNWARDLPDR